MRKFKHRTWLQTTCAVFPIGVIVCKLLSKPYMTFLSQISAQLLQKLTFSFIDSYSETWFKRVTTSG